jgi:hypothetical protein
MKHWILPLGKYEDVNTEDFYNDLINLYKKYGVSISHEDGHGGFILEKYNEFNVDWIKEASVTQEVVDILNKTRSSLNDIFNKIDFPKKSEGIDEFVYSGKAEEVLCKWVRQYWKEMGNTSIHKK